MHNIKPIHTLTRAELIEQGAAAADRGEEIDEASIRARLDSARLLIFEQGYFEHRVALAPCEKVARKRVCNVNPS